MQTQTQPVKNSFLWKKITIESKSSEPSKNQGNCSIEIQENGRRREDYLEELWKQNDKDRKSKQEYAEEDLAEEEPKSTQKIDWPSIKVVEEFTSEMSKQNTGNHINSQLIQEVMAQSIVQKFKIQDQSPEMSQQQIAMRVEILGKNSKRNRDKFIKVGEKVKQMKDQINSFQIDALLVIERTKEQCINLIQENGKHFLEDNNQKDIKIFQLQALLINKQYTIEKLNQQITKLALQNTQLNEKVFDLNQKIAQWDLQVQKKIKQYYAESSYRNLSIESNKDMKQYEKFNVNLSEMHGKIERLQAGELKIMNELEKIQQRERSHSKSFKLSKARRQQGESSENSMQEKYSMDLMEANTFRNIGDGLEGPESPYYQINKNDSKSSLGCLENNNSNSSSHIEEIIKKKKEFIGDPQHHKASYGENYSKFLQRKYRPYQYTHKLRNGKQEGSINKVRILTYGYNEKIYTPKNQLIAPNFRNNQQGSKSKVFRKPFNPESPKIIELSQKISKLQSQIRKQIDLTK